MDPLRWKEFVYDLINIQVNQQDYGMDFHVDFSITNPEWEIDPSNPQFLCEAYWGTLIAGSPDPAPLSWRVLGFPGNNPNAPQSVLQGLLGTEDYLLNLQLTENHPLGVPFYDWNPEWVSLSFSGWGFTLEYQFADLCIPEPATLCLLLLGGLAMLNRRR